VKKSQPIRLAPADRMRNLLFLAHSFEFTATGFHIHELSCFGISFYIEIRFRIKNLAAFVHLTIAMAIRGLAIFAMLYLLLF